MNHVVGTRIVGTGRMGAGRWQAVCDTCKWEGELHSFGSMAQADAIAHQGGTLRTVDRTRKPRRVPVDEPEMFPGVK